MDQENFEELRDILSCPCDKGHRRHLDKIYMFETSPVTVIL